MEALKLAMKMEEDGEQLYRELAAKATLVGFREIFNQLADDEAKHYRVFNAMREDEGAFQESTLLKNANNIFKQMIEKGELKNLEAY